MPEGVYLNDKKRTGEESLPDWLARTAENMQVVDDRIRDWMLGQRLKRLRDQAERALKRGFKKTMVDPQLVLDVIDSLAD